MPHDKLDLDLSNARMYLSSLASLRQKIIHCRTTGPEYVLVLNVHLPYDARVTVFMKTVNLYLVAFQGRSAVYALHDPTDDVVRILRDSGAVSAETKIHALSLGADHGSLGTEQYAFGWGDFCQCGSLSRYDGSQGYEMISKPLANLVCMLAEASRFLEIQNAFAGVARPRGQYWADVQETQGLYGLSSVKVSGIVWVWRKASRVWQYAAKADVGPRQGAVLVSQLKALCQRLENLLGAGGSKPQRDKVLERIVSAPSHLPPAAGETERLFFEARELARRFGALTKDQISDLMTLFGDPLILQAAEGLLMAAL